MFCMIAHNQILPGKAEATAKMVEKEFIPVMKKTPGFRGCYLVTGPKGEYTAILLFNDRAGADAYAASPDRKKALGTMKGLVAGDMKVEFGDVPLAVTA